jgi:hypothetical protein
VGVDAGGVELGGGLDEFKAPPIIDTILPCGVNVTQLATALDEGASPHARVTQVL